MTISNISFTKKQVQIIWIQGNRAIEMFPSPGGKGENSSGWHPEAEQKISRPGGVYSGFIDIFVKNL